MNRIDWGLLLLDFVGEDFKLAAQSGCCSWGEYFLKPSYGKDGMMIVDMKQK